MHGMKTFAAACCESSADDDSSDANLVSGEMPCKYRHFGVAVDTLCKRLVAFYLLNVAYWEPWVHAAGVLTNAEIIHLRGFKCHTKL